MFLEDPWIFLPWEGFWMLCYLTFPPGTVRISSLWNVPRAEQEANDWQARINRE
jgi:hypothetical protein